MNIGELTATLGVDDTALKKSEQSFRDYGRTAQTSIQQVNQAMGHQMGLIEATNSALVRLEKFRKEATNVDDLKIYNKRIEELNQRLHEYKTIGTESNKTVKQHIEQTASSVTQLQESFQRFHRIFNVVLGGAGIMTAFNLVKKGFTEVGSVMMSTEGTAEKYKSTMMSIQFQVDELKRSLATGGFSDLVLQLEQAATNGAALADQLEYIQSLSQALKLTTSEINLEASKELLIARNQMKPLKERQSAAQKYLDLMQQLAIAGKDVAEEEVKAAMRQSAVARSGLTEERLKWYVRNAELLEENKIKIENYLQLQKNIQSTEKDTNAGWSVNAELRKKNQEFINKNLKEQKETLAATDEIIKNIGADYANWQLIPDAEVAKLADAWAKVDQVQASANMKSARMTMTLSQIMGKETNEIEKLANEAKKLAEIRRYSIDLTPQYVKGLMDSAEATRLHQSHLGKLNTSLYQTVSINEKLQEELSQIAMREAALGDLYDANAEQIKAYNEAINNAYELQLKDPTPTNIENVKNLIEELKKLLNIKEKVNEEEKLGNKLAREFSSLTHSNIESVNDFANALRTAAISAIATYIAEAVTANVALAVKKSKTWWGAVLAGAAAAAATKALFNSIVPKFEHGGEGTVPPGYPNDSYPMLLSSGEHYKITPSEQNNLDRNQSVQVHISGDWEIKGDKLVYVINEVQRKRKNSFR